MTGWPAGCGRLWPIGTPGESKPAQVTHGKVKDLVLSLVLGTRQCASDPGGELLVNRDRKDRGALAAEVLRILWGCRKVAQVTRNYDA